MNEIQTAFLYTYSSYGCGKNDFCYLGLDCLPAVFSVMQTGEYSESERCVSSSDYGSL